MTELGPVIRVLRWSWQASLLHGLAGWQRNFSCQWSLYWWMEVSVKVLKLSAQGLPQSWISLEQAVTHYAADEVRWEAGQQVAVFHGGHNALTAVGARG